MRKLRLTVIPSLLSRLCDYCTLHFANGYHTELLSQRTPRLLFVSKGVFPPVLSQCQEIYRKSLFEIVAILGRFES